jgi:hypothetical protein
MPEAKDAKDLDALVAEAIPENLRKDIIVTFRDQKFTVGPPDKWIPYFQYLAERKNDLMGALAVALGDDGLDRFMELRPSMTEIMGFMASIQTAGGINAGESPASGS